MRPPAEPRCEECGEPFPVADGDDWLTYRRVSPRSNWGLKQRSPAGFFYRRNDLIGYHVVITGYGKAFRPQRCFPP